MEGQKDITVFEEGNTYGTNHVVSFKKKARKGDKFELEFDMKKSKVILYHNKKKIETIFRDVSDCLVPMIANQSDKDRTRVISKIVGFKNDKKFEWDIDDDQHCEYQLNTDVYSTKNNSESKNNTDNNNNNSISNNNDNTDYKQTFQWSFDNNDDEPTTMDNNEDIGFKFEPETNVTESFDNQGWGSSNNNNNTDWGWGSSTNNTNNNSGFQFNWG